MARVFLDANTLIDVIERKEGLSIEALASHALFISPLSLHILAYVYKYKCPSDILQAATQSFSLVSFTSELVSLASLGPTQDFEDNIQLQSASSVSCDIFLTSDQDLLKLGVFGMTRIVKNL